MREASGFLRMPQDEDLVFFLKLFHLIMLHVDILDQLYRQCACHKVRKNDFVVQVQMYGTTQPNIKALLCIYLFTFIKIICFQFLIRLSKK